jgi:hypothetical protein
MKNHTSKLLGWLFAFSLLAPIVSCADSEPINGFPNLVGPSSGTGGVTATGGDTGTATGGTPGTGGTATGGTPGTGGVVSTGGTPGTGGVMATGGAGGRGGMMGTGNGGRAGGTGTGNGGRGGGAGGNKGTAGGAGGASASATFAFVASTIMANCGGSTCHNGSQSVKFDVTDTATLYTNLTTMKAPDCKNVPLVTPSDPTMSALYLAITKMCGGTVPQMPDGKPALPTATQTAIQQWIMAGAPQS